MSKANARRGGVNLFAKASPHPDAHFVRVDPPPPGEGDTEPAAPPTFFLQRVATMIPTNLAGTQTDKCSPGTTFAT
jgi:hypothetical protein